MNNKTYSLDDLKKLGLSEPSYKEGNREFKFSDMRSMQHTLDEVEMSVWFDEEPDISKEEGALIKRAYDYLNEFAEVRPSGVKVWNGDDEYHQAYEACVNHHYVSSCKTEIKVIHSDFEDDQFCLAEESQY